MNASSDAMDTAADEYNPMVGIISGKLHDLGFEDASAPPAVAALLAGGLESPAFVRVLCMLCDEVNLLTRRLGLVFAPSSLEGLRDAVAALLRDFGDEFMWAPDTVLDAQDGRTYALDWLTSQLQLCRMECALAPVSAVDPLAAALAEVAARLGLLELVQPGASAAHVAMRLAEPVARVLEQQPRPRLIAADRVDMAQLARVNTTLRAHYETRKLVMLQRLAVSLKAFEWAKRAEAQREPMAALAAQSVAAMGGATCSISVWDVLLADERLLAVQRVSSRTSGQGSVARAFVLDGTVPDRGGRVGEGRLASKMPEFKGREEIPSADKKPRVGYSNQRGGGGGGGGGGGARKGKKKHGGDRTQGAVWAESDRKRGPEESPPAGASPAKAGKGGGGGKAKRGGAANNSAAGKPKK